MALLLSVHERVAIAEAFALQFGRELPAWPELIQDWEDETAEDGAQAFNRHFRLSFARGQIAEGNIRSAVCEVLPDTFGDTLFLTVGADTHHLLRVEFMGGQAPRYAYAPYAAQLQPWWRASVSRAQAVRARRVADLQWEALRRCTEDASLFDMLRVIIVRDRLCFFGQIGARTSVRTMAEALRFDESNRQLCIRADDQAIAIDGFADVKVTQADSKTFWLRQRDDQPDLEGP